MSVITLNSEDFGELASDILRAGHRLRFQARGNSMLPFVRDGDILEVERVDGRKYRCGDIVLCEQGKSKLIMHRVIREIEKGARSFYLLKGDALNQADQVISAHLILGRAIGLERDGEIVNLDSNLQRNLGLVWSLWMPRFRRIYWKLSSILRRIYP